MILIECRLKRLKQKVWVLWNIKISSIFHVWMLGEQKGKDWYRKEWDAVSPKDKASTSRISVNLTRKDTEWCQSTLERQQKLWWDPEGSYHYGLTGVRWLGTSHQKWRKQEEHFLKHWKKRTVNIEFYHHQKCSPGMRLTYRPSQAKQDSVSFSERLAQNSLSKLTEWEWQEKSWATSKIQKPRDHKQCDKYERLHLTLDRLYNITKGLMNNSIPW